MYFIVSFIVLAISFCLFRRAAGTMNPVKLNMINWIFYYDFFASVFISSILVVNNLHDHYMLNKIQNEETKYIGYWVVNYTMIAFPIGMLLCSLIMGYTSQKKLFSNYINKNLVPYFSAKDSSLRFLIYGFSIFSTFSLVLFFVKFGSVPLIKAIVGLDFTSLAQDRTSISRINDNSQLFFNFFAKELPIFLTFILFSYYKLYRTKTDKYWYYFMLLVSFFSLTYDLSKSPLVQFIIGLYINKIYLDGKSNILKLFKIGALVLFCLILSYTLIAGVSFDDMFGSFNTGILGRIFLSQSSGLYLMLEYFNSMDPIGFSSLSQFISKIFNIEYSERAARLLVYNYGMSGIEDGTAGVMNTLFIGEAFANFKWVGVILSPLYIGFLIQALFIWLLKSPKTPIYIGLLTFYSYRSSVTGGFNDYIYNPGFMFILLFTLFIILTAKNLKK